jgi:hypothetical protein
MFLGRLTMRSFRLSLVHVLILLACSLLILLHSGRSILREVFGTPVPAEIHSRYYLWTGKRLRLIHPNKNNGAGENYFKRFGLVKGDSPPTETADDVAILKKFAERYQPKSTTSRHIPSPPELKERELRSLKALSAAGSRAHEKYVLLIFLRLYRFHLENFQQSYHLGEIPLDPLTEEFHRLIGGSPPLGSLLSYAAEDWVKSKPELLRDKLIAREIARIDRAHKKIESRSRK